MTADLAAGGTQGLHRVVPVELIETVLEHDGATVPSWVVRPADGHRRAAVVIAAEAYGLNTFTRRVATDLASAGYHVVVPDYYRGHGLSKPDDYSDFTEVMEHIGRLDFVGATRDILAGVDHARALPGVDADRVVVWGYCTGGTLALMATASDRELAGAVWFFPSQPRFDEHDARHPVDAIDLLWQVRCPALLVYGDRDDVFTGVADDLRARIDGWGVDVRLSLYAGAGHAFSAPHPSLYHADADEDAWHDALAFLDDVSHRR